MNNSLSIKVAKLDHTDTTARGSGQSDLDFIEAAVEASNVNGCDLVAVNMNDDGGVVGGSPPPDPLFVVVGRQSGQRDQGFKGDISSAMKTAAGL